MPGAEKVCVADDAAIDENDDVVETSTLTFAAALPLPILRICTSSTAPELVRSVTDTAPIFGGLFGT